MINFGLFKWITVYVWISLEIAFGGAFQVNITDLHPAGSVIFNAGLGAGWKYIFNAKGSSHAGTHLLHLDQHSGEVSLLRNVDCDEIVRHNPFTVVIRAISENQNDLNSYNFTLVPLTVYVYGHGPSCYKFRHTEHHSSHKFHQNTQTAPLVISFELETPLKECLAKGTHILETAAYLPSALSNCHFHYRLLEKSTKFHLNHSNGDLRTMGSICLTYPFVLRTRVKSHCTNPKATFNIPVEIALYAKGSRETEESKLKRSRRATNRPPSFQQQTYSANVPEEQNVGYSIMTITATDPDTGPAGFLTYSLVATRDGRSQNMFTIDPSSGQISTAVKLDRESMDKHYFMVEAMDDGNPQRTAIASLTVIVDDANDHTPTFERDLYTLEVSESTYTGSTVLTVRARDVDAGKYGEIAYSILNPNGVNKAFYIDQDSGSIITRQSLDREQTTFYSLQVQASDKATVTDRRSSTATVEITILDENDNKPQFSQSTYSMDVSEDIDPSGGPVISEVHATDADAGHNALVRYSITGGNTLDTFNIDAITGAISVQRSLNYEDHDSYRLNIQAKDSGNPPKSNSTTLLVRVIDVNDNSPRFYTSSYHETILESSKVGFTVMRVQAYDQDAGKNAELVYTLVDAPDSLPMKLDSQTGLLTTSRELDREEQARYSFKVVAADQGDPPRSATTAIEVTIEDVNDNAPVFDPRIYNEVVSEEIQPGYPVVTVTATDADEEGNSRVTYMITSGNIKGAFNIISQMGQGLITVARTLNYKDQNRYILTVTATDPGGQLDTCSVFINVTDANTYRPQFIGAPYNFRVNEDEDIGSTIFKVMATDGDVGENARISYTISENSAFDINAVTGDIVVKKSLDREMTAGYTVSVTATDHGRPSKSDTTDVEIIVNDVNDNFPKFLMASYQGEVAEDAIVGTSILIVSATDDDQGLNGRVRYTFENGNSGDGDFMIDPTLGILRTAKELDRETISSYKLQAFAVDRGHAEKSTSVVISIQVGDINDNAPEFPPGKLELFILENSPIESAVGSLEAIDPDEGINAEVDYSIVGGPDADSFSLITRRNEAAIAITLIELDYESGKIEYSIMVRARSFHLFSDTMVTIQVQDVNDNEPQLKDFTLIFNNYKNYFPTEEIGRIPAHDPDVADELKYDFVSGNEADLLHLDRLTGRIMMNSRLNSDVPTNGTLVVSVTGM